MIVNTKLFLERLTKSARKMLIWFWFTGFLNIISSTIRHWHEEIKGILALDFVIFCMLMLGTGCLFFFETRGGEIDWSQGKSDEANAEISKGIGRTLIVAAIIVFIYSMCVDIRDILALRHS